MTLKTFSVNWKKWQTCKLSKCTANKVQWRVVKQICETQNYLPLIPTGSVHTPRPFWHYHHRLPLRLKCQEFSHPCSQEATQIFVSNTRPPLNPPLTVIKMVHVTITLFYVNLLHSCMLTKVIYILDVEPPRLCWHSPNSKCWKIHCENLSGCRRWFAHWWSFRRTKISAPVPTASANRADRWCTG